MNPALRDIVKEELQKLLNVNFIYPISDSRWVSPLVAVLKKNGKWRICVDYRELSKATLRDYFPFPFIDQVLDTLSGKKYFSFWMGLADTIKSKLPQKIRRRIPLLAHGVPMPIESFLSGCVTHLLPSKGLS
jgi:hypothetical protein